MENGNLNMLKVKSCYGHLGGTLGNRLFEKMIEMGWFEQDWDDARSYHFTETGKVEFEKMGVDLYQRHA